jgi:hypothetical protein
MKVSYESSYSSSAVCDIGVGNCFKIEDLDCVFMRVQFGTEFLNVRLDTGVIISDIGIYDACKEYQINEVILEEI